jgi:hypothetical protein
VHEKWRGDFASPLVIIVTCLNESIMFTKRDVSERREDNMEEMLKLISNFGFPIVVSAYLLVRIEGKLSELTTSITELAKAVAVIKA